MKPSGRSFPGRLTAADRRRSRQPKAMAAWFAAAALVVTFASDVKFRSRPAELGLDGVVDGQILFELAMYGALGVALVYYVLRRERGWLGRNFPRGVGPCLQLTLAIVGVSAVLAARSGTQIAIGRAAQLAILVALHLLLARGVSTGRVDLDHWWLYLRRGIWLIVAVLVISSALAPPTLVPIHTSGRYHWFSSHPIFTATTLGIGIVLLAATSLASPDPLLEYRSIRNMRMLMMGAGGVLLLNTASRGPIVATLVALTVLVAFSPNARPRAQAVLAVGASLGLILAGLFEKQLSEAFLRGQTSAQLMTLTGRTELFAYAWTLIAERPVLGYGFLSGRSIFLERFPWAGHSHNAFIEIAISMGLVGLVLYAALLGRQAWQLRVAVQRSCAQGALHAREALALLAFLLVLSVTGGGLALPVGIETMILLVIAVVADHVALPAHVVVPAGRDHPFTGAVGRHGVNSGTQLS